MQKNIYNQLILDTLSATVSSISVNALMASTDIAKGKDFKENKELHETTTLIIQETIKNLLGFKQGSNNNNALVKALEKNSRGLLIRPGSILEGDRDMTTLVVGDNDLSVRFQKEISIFRKFTLPDIREFQASVVNKLAVKELALAPVVKELTFVTLPEFAKEYYENTPNVPPKPIDFQTSVHFPLPTGISLKELCLTGTMADVEIEKYLSSFHDSELRKVWEKYLFDINMSNRALSTLSSFENSQDVYLLLLLTKGWLEYVKTRTGKNGLFNISHYESLHKLFNYVSLVLQNHVQMFGIYEESKQVVFKITDKEAFVYKPSYDQYLESGGEIETLYGAILASTGNAIYLLDLKTNSELYEKRFRNFISNQAVKNKIQLKDASFNILFFEFLEYMEKERPYMDTKLNLEGLVKKIIGDGLASGKSIEDICGEVISIAGFSKTNGRWLYEFGEKYKRLYPSLPSDKCVYFGTVELITKVVFYDSIVISNG